VVSGVLLWLSFPAPGLYFLPWIALIPYLAFLLSKPTFKYAVAANYLMGSVFFGGILYWIKDVLNLHGGLTGWAAAGVFALLLLLLSSFLSPFTLGVWILAARSKALALAGAPGLWVLCELLREYFPFGGFPWGALGYSQFDYLWIVQIVDLGGIHLLSYLILMANCAILWCMRLCSWRYPAAFLGVWALANLYGVYRLHIWEPESQEPLDASMVQGSIGLFESRDYYSRVYFEELARSYKTAAVENPDLIVFAETPNPFIFGKDYYFTSFWKKLVRDYEVPLMLNGTGVHEGSEGYYNTLFLIGRGGELSFRYDKVRLVPFGEYLPFGGLIGFAEALVQEVSHYSPGSPEGAVGTLKGWKFAPLICFEAVFPSLSRSAVRQGAEFLVNITNDSWFGRSSAATQHLQMACFRAVETRKPMLRCANSGITAIVDEKGRITQNLGLHKKGTVRGQIRPNRVRTVYGLLGETPVIFLIIFSIGLYWFPLLRLKFGKE